MGDSETSAGAYAHVCPMADSSVSGEPLLGVECGHEDGNQRFHVETLFTYDTQREATRDPSPISRSPSNFAYSFTVN